eukprot:3097539-Amphidinium_carterae.1
MTCCCRLPFPHEYPSAVNDVDGAFLGCSLKDSVLHVYITLPLEYVALQFDFVLLYHIESLRENLQLFFLCVFIDGVFQSLSDVVFSVTATLTAI